jgi:hypothetical protein
MLNKYFLIKIWWVEGLNEFQIVEWTVVQLGAARSKHVEKVKV